MMFYIFFLKKSWAFPFILPSQLHNRPHKKFMEAFSQQKEKYLQGEADAVSLYNPHCSHLMFKQL